MKEDVLRRLKFRLDLVALLDDKPVLDRRSAMLLKLIDERGSILSACRSLGIPYSNAWSMMVKTERSLGMRIIEPAKGGRGGGGTRLTEAGKRLLETYMAHLKVVSESVEVETAKPIPPDLLIAGSHDPLLEDSIEDFKTFSGLRDVEVSWIGSAGGLASVMLGEADVAGVRLKDPETGVYNTPFLAKYWLDDKAVVIRGFKRLIVFAYRHTTRFRGVDDILAGKVRLVNRVLGSGTRLLLDQLLKARALRLGIEPREIPSRVLGYDFEVKTHHEVAKGILEDKGDVGLTLKYIAEKYGLAYTPVCWENYDFVVRVSRLDRKPVKAFIGFLKSSVFQKRLKRFDGYDLSPSIGEVIYAPPAP